MTEELQEGALRIYYIPQIPMPAFRVEVANLATAHIVLDTIISFSVFEFENNIKPDYSDAGGIERWESDGYGGYDWFEVNQEDES